MKIAGSYSFPASRQEVWDAINDPEVLARAIPGCQKLDQVGEHEFESTLKVGLQAVKGVYSGRVTIDDLQPPNHYRIHVDGKGTNGFMQGTGTIDLAEDGDKTKLTYGGDAQVGGTIASVGQRLIDGAAKTLINQSLKALAQQIELRRNGGSDDDGSSSEPASAAAPAEPAAPAASETKSDASTSSDLGEKFISSPEIKEDAAADTTVNSDSAASKPAIAGGDTATTAAPAKTNATPPATTTMLSSNPLPPTPVKAPAAASGSTNFQPRSIVVPEGEGLSEAAVMQGMVSDFIGERPWIPWVFVAFLLGFLVGRRG